MTADDTAAQQASSVAAAMLARLATQDHTDELDELDREQRRQRDPILRHASPDWLTLAGIPVDEHGAPRAVRYRVRCPGTRGERHVIALVVDARHSAPAVVYLKRRDTPDGMAARYRQDWPDDVVDLDDKATRKAVTHSSDDPAVVIRPVGRRQADPAPPAWCPRCRSSRDLDIDTLPVARPSVDITR